MDTFDCYRTYNRLMRAIPYHGDGDPIDKILAMTPARRRDLADSVRGVVMISTKRNEVNPT